MNNEEYICKRKKVGEIFEIKCDTTKENKDSEKKIIHCLFGTEEKTGGISAASFGVEYGKQKPVLTCFSDDQFKEEVAKELKTNKDNIKFISND